MTKRKPLHGGHAGLLQLVRQDVEYLAHPLTRIAIKAARSVVAQHRSGMAPPVGTENWDRTVERAEAFLRGIGKAISDVPKPQRSLAKRNQDIVELVQHFEHHVRAAKRVIVGTPKNERLRESRIKQFVEMTRLPDAIVRQIAQRPRSGPTDLAYQHVAQEFGLAEERIRKIVEKHRAQYPVRHRFYPMARKVQPTSPGGRGGREKISAQEED